MMRGLLVAAVACRRRRRSRHRSRGQHAERPRDVDVGCGTAQRRRLPRGLHVPGVRRVAGRGGRGRSARHRSARRSGRRSATRWSCRPRPARTRSPHRAFNGADCGVELGLDPDDGGARGRARATAPRRHVTVARQGQADERSTTRAEPRAIVERDPTTTCVGDLTEGRTDLRVSAAAGARRTDACGSTSPSPTPARCPPTCPPLEPGMPAGAGRAAARRSSRSRTASCRRSRRASRARSSPAPTRPTPGTVRVVASEGRTSLPGDNPATGTSRGPRPSTSSPRRAAAEPRASRCGCAASAPAARG